MGNGLFVVCLALALIFRFKRRKQGITMLFGFLFSAVLVQLLKNIDNISQPAILMEQGQNLFLTDGISVADQGSFISGHTTIAFALATILILQAKNSKLQLPLLFAALLLGYSRMYLGQHSLLDILIGAVVGTISGIAAVYFAYYFKGPGYYFKKFFNMNKNVTMTRERNIQPV
jgi:membrane-associated phospholipid phosphatase